MANEHDQQPGRAETTPAAGGTPGNASVVTTCAARGTVTLSKGPHRWTFTCERGGEQDMLRRLAELARREDVPFDWFDAALVSHQLRSRLLPGLVRVKRPQGK